MGGPGPQRPVLVVRQRRETVAIPSFRQMPAVGSGDQEAVVEN